MRTPLSLLFLVSAAVLSGCVSTYGKDDIRLENGQLYRGDSDFTFRAVRVPELTGSGAALPVMVPAMARVADVGGNAVCYEFPASAEADAAALAEIGAIASRAKDQRMYVVVRVDGSLAEERIAAIATLLKEERRVIYWIDGGAAGAVSTFRSHAPRAVVAAEGNGDMRVLRAAPETLPAEPVLVAGVVPAQHAAELNVVLPAASESYSSLEEALKTAEERQPWTPDNSALSAEEQAEGFVALFNGRDLDGWWFFGDNKNGFRVRDGIIEWAEDGASAIMTVKRYGDFVLRLEYLTEQDHNSGIFLRAPRAARQSKIGMEFQIHGNHTAEPSDDMVGAIYTVVPPTSNASKPAGEWNALEILCQGPHLIATLNGTVIQDINLDDYEELKYRLRRGFIGLQDHHEYVAFRNVRIKEL